MADLYKRNYFAKKDFKRDRTGDFLYHKKSSLWQSLRRKQLLKMPFCQFCHDFGVVKKAEVVDHIKPHKGDMDLFKDPDNLQSLCKKCHDKYKQYLENLNKSKSTGQLPVIPIPNYE